MKSYYKLEVESSLWRAFKSKCAAQGAMMTIEKKHNGITVISELVNGMLITRQYIFYSKKQAIQNFKQFINKIKEVK